MLRDKFKMLLKSSDAQFEGIWTELEIAKALTERFSPISLEPLVSEFTSANSKPRSPDFALRLPEGDVCIEATVLRVGFLQQWDKEADWLSNEISRRAKKRGLSTAIELQLSIDFSRKDLSGNAIGKLLDSIAASPTGEATLASKGGNERCSWSPVAIFSFGHSGAPEVALSSTLPNGVAHAISISRRPFASGAIDERVLDSVRNTPDLKRNQRVFDGPYLVAIKLGDHRISSDGIKALLAQRIWSNTQYGGISGIVHYLPSQGFGASDPLHSLSLQPNDHARAPVPESVFRGFQGTAQFHLS